MTESKIVIRKCNNLDEIFACVALQKEERERAVEPDR